MTDWFVSENKCLEKESCREKLAVEVDIFLEKIAKKYNSLGIDRKPVAFVKNDRGTYGLGIMAISSGEELLNLSNRMSQIPKNLEEAAWSLGSSRIRSIFEIIPPACKF